jgi:hypothetical protein
MGMGPEQIIVANKTWLDRRCIGIILCCQLAAVFAAHGQQVLPQLPTVPTTPPAVEAVETNSAGYIDFGKAAPTGALQQHPFQVGPFDLHPHAFYQFLYSTGVQSTPGSPHNIITQDVAPGLLVGLGKDWTLDYTPTWTFYSGNQGPTNAFRNTLGHAAILSGGVSYDDWLVRLSQTYTRTDTPLITTGGQTVQETFGTSLTGSYPFNTVMSMDLSASQDLMYYDKLTNTREWSTLDRLNYQFWPRLDVNIGIGGGYDNVSVGVDSVFEEYELGVSWRATDVTSFQVHGGVEDRQFLDSGEGDLISPIFDAAVTYKPFRYTAIVVDGDRSVSMSPFADEIIEATDLTVALNQRLLSKLFLSGGGGYHWNDYRATSTTVTANRRDQYYTLSVSLTCVFLEHGRATATYARSEDSSSLAGFGYNSNSYGFQLGFEY